MAAPTTIGIIDIGKTNAKFALVDIQTKTELAVRTIPNVVLNNAPYSHFDIDRIWEFLKHSIRELNREHPIEAVSITTHGACAVLIDENGNLALPVVDYEHDGPERQASDYEMVRPDFATSFSPSLPFGLNLGAQLFWLQKSYPDEFENARWIIPYPQYWAYRLSGIVATEITSIGCHTDMWDFCTNDYSSLVDACNWREKMPPMHRASDILGPVQSHIAEELSLDEDIPVHCGIHDSNASLLPHLMERKVPFSVVSTGTWVIVCSPGGELKKLDEHRDCLANIDMFGHPVPSARFMGGREFSSVIGENNHQPQSADIQHVLKQSITLLPSMEIGTGPFPQAQEQWSHDKSTLSPEVLYVVVSFYLAMMTAECLELSDGRGDAIVEGPFARNTHYLAMLSAVTRGRIIANTDSATGTSIGAAALVSMKSESALSSHASDFFRSDDGYDYHNYAKQWRLKNANRKTL